MVRKMNANTNRPLFVSTRIIPGMALALLSGIYPGAPALADDTNISPSACEAPFLSQAERMRWHESYLMNPTSSVATWVVCPVTFDNDELASGSTLTMRIQGTYMSGAASWPTCSFHATDAWNRYQAPYSTATPNYKYNQALALNTYLSNTVWMRSGNVDMSAIEAAIGTDRDDWQFAVSCYLPPGISISQIELMGPG
jgi:hypothetical protein